MFLHAGMSTGLFHFHSSSCYFYIPHLKVFFYYTVRLSEDSTVIACLLFMRVILVIENLELSIHCIQVKSKNISLYACACTFFVRFDYCIYRISSDIRRLLYHLVLNFKVFFSRSFIKRWKKCHLNISMSQFSHDFIPISC